ncbi:uncharacterized protein ACNS7B_017522 [Menidia menidia]
MWCFFPLVLTVLPGVPAGFHDDAPPLGRPPQSHAPQLPRAQNQPHSMSDPWTSSSPPPVAHLSSLSHPLPPLSNHGNPPPAKVSSPLLTHSQVSSPLLTHSQVSSPLLTHPQVSSPLLTHSQVSSPLLTHSQVISPHFSYPHFAPQASTSHSFYQNQIPPTHFPSSQMNSPHHLASPQMSSPLLPHPHDPSPHLLPPPQHFSFSQSADPELDYSDWDRCESSEQSCFLSFSCQSQPTAHLNPQTQRPFVLGQTLPGDPSQTSYRPQVFEQGDTPGQNHYSWGGGVPALPSLAQQQCSPLGSTSADGALRGWSSLDFASLSAEDFPTGQLFHENYHGSQPFCSPTTPGPSPHPPQTPAVPSPGPQVYLRRDGIGSQTLLNPLDCCLNQFESHLLAPDPGRPPPHQTHEDLGGQLQAAGGSEAEGGPRRDILPDLSWIQVKRMQPESSTELLGSRLLCTVCKRDFRSLPALNGHMRSHSGFRSPTMLKKALSPPGPNPVSMVMPVSVPVQTRRVSPGQGGGQQKTPRRRALYHSLMHEAGRGDGGHYTPPPMLSPQRGGPGLYCSLTPARPHSEPGDPVSMATASASGPVPPRINLGRRFQAEVPPLRARNAAHASSHNATLLWTPWDKLEGPGGQQRVEALLMMAKSSVLLGGGSSPEYVLQVLSESRGDFLKTVEKLLTAPKPSSLSRTGVSWSPGEKRLLLKSLQLHHKDFSSIQRAVKTKSLSECVEFYYLWKKKLSLGLRTPAGLTVTLPDSNGQRLWKHQKAS